MSRKQKIKPKEFVPDVGLKPHSLGTLDSEICVHGQMNSLERSYFAGIEILDESRVAVELRSSGIPANNDFFGIDTLMQLKHGTVVLHINSNFTIVLLMGNVEAVSDLNFSTVIAANTEQSANNSFLSFVATKVVIEDRKEDNWVDDTGEWSECWRSWCRCEV